MIEFLASLDYMNLRILGWLVAVVAPLVTLLVCQVIALYRHAVHGEYSRCSIQMIQAAVPMIVGAYLLSKSSFL